ncbi:unnamed protein product, partial [marine sediment metagenome]
MYGEDEKVSGVYTCPKCKRRMGNNPDTIKKHGEM